MAISDTRQDARRISRPPPGDLEENDFEQIIHLARTFTVADAHALADRLERNQRPQSDQAMAAKLIARCSRPGRRRHHRAGRTISGFSGIPHGPAALRCSPQTRSEDQRTGGARAGGGVSGAGLRAGTAAGDGGGAEVLSGAPCAAACSLVISAASLSTLCRTTARPRDIATS